MRKKPIKDFIIQQLKESCRVYNEQCSEDDQVTLAHYICIEKENDPGLGRWLFDDDTLSDFEVNDELKELVKAFMIDKDATDETVTSFIRNDIDDDIILVENNKIREIYIVRAVYREDLKRFITRNRKYEREFRTWDHVQYGCRTSAIYAFVKKKDAIDDCRKANSEKDSNKIYYFTANSLYT